uniref:FUN14 domain-containing protein 2 n=2 Tax=Equus TaxID=9789 RepID=A0A9L0RH20_HORSE
EWKHLPHVPEASLRRRRRATPRPIALSPCGCHRETSSPKWPRPLKVTAPRGAAFLGSGRGRAPRLLVPAELPREPKRPVGGKGAQGSPLTRQLPGSGQGNFEGNFDSLDLAEFAKKQPWWRKLFGQESGPSAEKYSVATQLLIGGVTGWCTGFIFQKVGKLAATAVGGGFFLLQLANHTGYIKVDWQRVEKDMKKAKEQLKIRKSNQIPTEVKSKAEEVVSFVKKNVIVTGGFFGGFLLGMAS